MIDHLQTRYLDDDDVGIAYVYCNFRSKAEQTARDLMGSILRQFLLRATDITIDTMKIYETCVRRGMLPSFQDLLSCLRSVMSSFSRSFIVIDALDESLVSRDGRDRLLSELFKLQGDKTSLNLLATSRFIPDIEQRFEGCLITEIRGHEDDLRRYITSSLSLLRPFVQRNVDLQKDIVDTVATSVDGMYVLT